MAEFPPFKETYSLTITYYTVCQDLPTTPEDHLCIFGVHALYYDTHTTVVRVTNSGDTPLSACDLKSLALSIPELNHQLLGYTHVPMLLDPIMIWVERLHWDTAGQPFSSQIQPGQPQPPRQAPTDSPAAELTQLPLLAASESYSPIPADCLIYDESFITDQEQETKWTTLTYMDHDIIRSFCPIYCTDSEVEVMYRCNVSDYTAYGEAVFSVDVDFLR